jgi:anti-sigma regulatory factor (Ser/Thr protein kinase)
VDDDQHELVSAIQDASLPRALPVLPTLDLGLRFLVPVDAGEAAGTFYDAVVLPSGSVALTVGQVPGGGVAATVAAIRVGAVLRASLVHHEDLVRALALADAQARSAPDEHGTSVVVAVLDPGTGDLAYATCGHDAPLVLSPAGARRLGSTSHGPLGRLAEPRCGRERLGPDEHLALVAAATAGSSAAGPEGAAGPTVRPGEAAAESGAALAEDLADTQHRGAVVVLTAAPRREPVTDLEVDVPLDGAAARAVRHELGAWLGAVGAPTMDALAIVHATTELVANAFDHAHPSGTRFVRVVVRARHELDGEVVVDVVDRGRWREPRRDEGRGRGLAMAAGLVDALSVTSDDDGTRAGIRHRLARPVVLERRAAGVAVLPVALDVVDDDRGVVSLTGVFGHDEVDQVTHALLLASRGGTRRLSIDLSDVSDLSAGAVRLLGDVVAGRGPGGAGAAVDVLVRRGSAPHADLVRAGVAHRTP